MSGAKAIPVSSDGIRRQRVVRPPTTADVVQTSILASLSDKHRITKGGVKFNALKISKVKQLYQEAVGRVINSKTGNLTAMEAASRVTMMYNINIAEIDRPRIKASVNNNIRAAKVVIPMIEILSDHDQVTATA